MSGSRLLIIPEALFALLPAGVAAYFFLSFGLWSPASLAACAVSLAILAVEIKDSFRPEGGGLQRKVFFLLLLAAVARLNNQILADAAGLGKSHANAMLTLAAALGYLAVLVLLGSPFPAAAGLSKLDRLLSGGAFMICASVAAYSAFLPAPLVGALSVLIAASAAGTIVIRFVRNSKKKKKRKKG